MAIGFLKRHLMGRPSRWLLDQPPVTFWPRITPADDPVIGWFQQLVPDSSLRDVIGHVVHIRHFVGQRSFVMNKFILTDYRLMFWLNQI